nr:MAG: putative RNA-dependent RNA polymerase [Botourmiaviridae sp.]
MVTQSRSCRVKTGGSGSRETFSGGRAKNRACTCGRTAHATSEAIARGLRLVRVRFSLPRGELPEVLEPGDLDNWLLRLLRGGSSPLFPRAQRGFDEEGFPRLLRLGRRQRWEFAATLASMKRGLRATPCYLHPPPSSFPSWRANCSQDPPPVSPEYLRFVRNVVKREFPLGWDSGLYESFVESFIPRNSARFDTPVTMRAGLDIWRDPYSRQSGGDDLARFSKLDFERLLRGGEPDRCVAPDYCESFFLRYKEVPAVGKVRPMGIPTEAWDLLGPLHKTIYEFISRKKWCLKGPPTPSRIANVCTYAMQTSVDLVNATDGLPWQVTETILGALLSKATQVPGRIRQMAHESLLPRFFGPGGAEGFVTHGQMMGTYLSFPLLCVQSYCMARWATRGKKANLLVNGDDCLISCDSAIPATSYPPFAVINDRKTLRAAGVAEINSTQFLSKGRGWRRVPVLRRGVGYTDVEGVYHLAKACREAGRSWQEAFVKSSLDAGVLPSELGLSDLVPGVYKRECRLRATVYKSPPPPAPSSDSQWELLPEKPTLSGQIAFRRDLWLRGRVADPSPKADWSLYRSVRYRPRWSRLTRLPFRDHLALARLQPSVKKPKQWCHSPDFDDYRAGSMPRIEVDGDGEAFLVVPS